MSAESKDYLPLPRKVTDRILDIWKFYKETIGLEGELVFNMRKNGASEEAISQAKAEHRENREEMMPLYKEYKQEKREEDEREQQTE